MVGLFHLTSKGSPARITRSTDSTRPTAPPPPPYTPSGHDTPVFAAETTTTTTHIVTTTTHTTTHFFSLPLWRRRTHSIAPFSASPSGKPDNSTTLTNEMGVVHSASTPAVLMRDKDLPPTPPSETESLRRSMNASASQVGGNYHRISEHHTLIDGLPSSGSPLVPLSVPGLPTPRNSTDQPTATLARAALGLGVPALMLNPTPSSSSSNEINSVTFVVPATPASPQEERKSSFALRRAKSFQKDPVTSSSASPTGTRETRRVRGLSLGPLLSMSEGKGKEKERPSESKSLSRKSSFWSRKRHDSRVSTPVSPPSPAKFLQQPPLPDLQPASPFLFNSTAPRASYSRPDESRVSELRRRHSERAFLQGSVAPQSGPSELPNTSGRGFISARRRSKRPSTADSATMSPRPTSAYFPTPAPFTSSPSPMATPPPCKGNSYLEYRQPTFQPVIPRPRSQTNPPFLHRLSMNLFGSPPTHSPASSSVTGEPYSRSPATSISESSRPSLSRPSPKVSIEIPKPRHLEESPEAYLNRLVEAASKAEVATVLASSADEFHAQALRAYINRFDFNNDPLDVALRRLLMDVGLPRETQQIDRVIEAFAARYRECHPGLFVSEDHPYILAFSLIMLHTDAFNKSNKRKMTKADYMKNTRLPGVPPEVLDCFYDNIVFVPFIFIEDPIDVNGQRGLIPEATSSRRLSSFNSPSPGGVNGSGSNLLGKGSRIDPYYLISKNLLDDLRVDVETFVSATSPYSYQGTAGPWDEELLLRAFALARRVEVNAPERYTPPPWFSLNVGGGPSTTIVQSTSTYSSASNTESALLKVTKFGLVLRKEDVPEGGRKANSRKWRELSVLLTGSQLLFWRDLSMFQQRITPTNGDMTASNGVGVLPKPDELLSLKDAVAVFDRSHSKHSNTLRLVMPHGRHYLMQMKDEDEMNGWIASINYAATFKTAGVRMRSLGMSGKDIELTGQAAAASHLRDLQQQNKPVISPRIRTWGNGFAENERSIQDGVDELMTEARSPIDCTEEPTTPPLEHPSGLFKATFDQVKADLASGDYDAIDAVSIRSGRRPRAYSLESVLQTPTSPTFRSSESSQYPRLSSRSQIIRSKIRDLVSQIAVQQTQLESDLRFVQNMAVLTPFQRATRDRLQAVVRNVAKHIMQGRLEMEKLTCYRDVLTVDLTAEERAWSRTKKIALKAATDKLQIERKRSMPRMMLSVRVDDSEATSSHPRALSPRRPNTADSRIAESSTGESFHSALDYNPNWPVSSADDTERSLTSDADRGSRSPTMTNLTNSSEQLTSHPEYPGPALLTKHSSMESTAEDEHLGAHEKFYTASETSEEQAEEWNKTRAGKRVSLVRLPSDLRMTALFGRHAREGSQNISSETATIAPSLRSRRSISSPVFPLSRSSPASDNTATLDA